jgi:hypothetical protein
MHTVVRRYDNATQLFDELSSREQDVREVIMGSPGFVSYLLVRTDNGGMSITTCQDKAGTDESSRRAADWIKQNLPNLSGATPTITEGEVMFRFVDRAAAQAVLAQQQAAV